MQKHPFIDLEQAQRIIEDVPTPFHIYDEKGIRENARRLNAAFAWNEGYKEYFAVKATPTPALLKILQEEGCGVDCSTYTELLLSEACGFTGQDVMFSSNVTPVQDMKKACQMGAYINLDDYTHVEFLDRVAGVPETVFCRYNPGGVFSMGNDIMDNPGEAKYGMTEEQMASAFEKLMKKGAKQFGIHAFLASNTTSNDYYPALAEILFRLAVRLNKATGAKIKFINLSGGVGVDYRPESPPATLPPSVRVCAKSSRRFWCPPAWAMCPSSPSWAGSCWPLTAIWWPLCSTKSISRKTIWVWMPAPPI